MIEFIKVLTYFVVSIIMLSLMVIVGLIPMVLVQLYNVPEYDFISRVIGCVLVIPMFRYTFKVLDYTLDILEK